MSYAQIKVYLTEDEIDTAILKAARDHMIPMERGTELYVVDWGASRLDQYGIEANLAFREEEKNLPPLTPEILIRG